MTTTKDTDPKKVGFIGDTHANLNWTVRAIKHLKNQGAEHILQVGDFGYDPGRFGQSPFVMELSDCLEAWDLSLWWIDGNHEDHAELRRLPVDSETGRVHLTEHVHYLPRGYQWTWNGINWMGVGGAVSVDKVWRTPGYDWFPEEALSRPEVDRIIKESKGALRR